MALLSSRVPSICSTKDIDVSDRSDLFRVWVSIIASAFGIKHVARLPTHRSGDPKRASAAGWPVVKAAR